MHAWAPVDGVIDSAYLQRMAELGVLDAVAAELEIGEHAPHEFVENAAPVERGEQPAEPPDDFAVEAKLRSP